MFEYLFENQGMPGSNIRIGGNVVDETRKITVTSTEEEEEFPWWMVIAAVGGVVVLIGLVFAFKGR